MRPGTYTRRRRSTCESHLRLDVRSLARAGALKPGPALRWQWSGSVGRYTVVLKAGPGHVTVAYPPERDDSPLERELILVTTTRCHYGGVRWWWQCPLCSTRRAVLYLHHPGGFYCRRCLDLAYTSTRENDRDRLRYRITCLRHRLGLPDDTMNGFSFPTKPPRMHWHTFTRLRDQLREAEGSYYAVLSTLLAVMKQRVAVAEANPMR